MRWSQSQASGAKSRPLVSGDLVYFGTGTGDIVARDFETGVTKWSTRVISQSEVAGANLLLRQGVLIAAGVWTVGGVDAASGTLRWTFTSPLDTVDAGGSPGPGLLTQTHMDADGTRVYVPAWGASVSALDSQTGQPVWIWRPGRAPTDTAANVFRSGAEGTRVSGDSVFVTAWHWLDGLGNTSENWLLILDRLTGRELARLTVRTVTGHVSTIGAPVLYGNLVIFTGLGGYVWAVDRSTWQVAWRFTPTTQYMTSTQAELHGDTLYFDGADEFLYAIKATDGSLIWKVKAGGTATRDLLITDKRIYYPQQGTLKIFDKATGAFVVETSVNSVAYIFETPPAFARARVFVATTPVAQSFDEP